MLAMLAMLTRLSAVARLGMRWRRPVHATLKPLVSVRALLLHHVRVRGSGFGGFSVRGLSFRVQGSGCGVESVLLGDDCECSRRVECDARRRCVWQQPTTRTT
eukprot:1220588-Rhodomonas_salina.1